jgi:hypothetical protein
LFDISLHFQLTCFCAILLDKSSFCDKDLLQLFATSKQGTHSTRLVVNQNPKRWSLLSAILVKGMVALTTTPETFSRAEFEHYLEFDLVSTCQSNDSASSWSDITS